MTKSTFIVWSEVTKELDHWVYVGGGVTSPVMKDKTITRYARWSCDTSPNSVAAAKRYIKTDMSDSPNARVSVCDDRLAKGD